MEKIINQKHGVNPWLISVGHLFERIGYYGVRGLLVLYMISEVINLDQAEAFAIYGWFSAALIFSSLVGAVFGDLVMGSKTAVIIGSIMQALGAFVLCIPNQYGIYAGLFLIVVGSGLFRPNILAHLGKQYLNKKKLLDAGFSINYMAVNLGALIGASLIGYFGTKLGWNFGFIAAGISILLSLIFIVISPEVKVTPSDYLPDRNGDGVIKIFLAIVILGVFWAVYDFFGYEMYNIQDELSSIIDRPLIRPVLSSLNAIFMIPLAVLLILSWTFFYSKSYTKLAIGFIFGVLGFALLFVIPEAIAQQHLFFYLLSVLFLALAEFFIAPIVYTVITKYSNPKYLAIFIALAFIPSRLFTYLIGFIDINYENKMYQISGILLMLIISIGLIAYYFISKGRKQQFSDIIDSQI